MSEPVTDLDAIKDEMNSVALSSISRLLQYLANHYGDHFEDDVELNKEFLGVTVSLIGEMLAHFPEDQQEQITAETFANIEYMKAMTVLELSMDESEAEEEEAEPTIVVGYDLTKMPPVGNC